jgi:hypothetical protein
VETGKKVSEVLTTGFTPHDIAFRGSTTVPITCSLSGIRSWDFPFVHTFNSGYSQGFFTNSNYDFVAGGNFIGIEKKCILYPTDSLSARDSVAIGPITKVETITSVSANGKLFASVEYKGMDAKYRTVNTVHVRDFKTGSLIAQFEGDSPWFTSDENKIFYNS